MDYIFVISVQVSFNISRREVAFQISLVYHSYVTVPGVSR